MVTKKFLLVKTSDLSDKVRNMFNLLRLGIQTIDNIVGFIGKDVHYEMLSMEEYSDKINFKEIDVSEYSITVINIETDPAFEYDSFRVEYEPSIDEVMKIGSCVDEDTETHKVFNQALESLYEKLFCPSLAVVSEDTLDFFGEASEESIVTYNSDIKVGSEVVSVGMNVCGYNVYACNDQISQDVIEKILTTPIKDRMFELHEIYDLNRNVYVAHIVYLPNSKKKLVSYILRKDVGL